MNHLQHKPVRRGIRATSPPGSPRTFAAPNAFARRKNAYRRVIVLGVAIVALLALPASVAQAAPVTQCDGTIGAVVVEGEIHVPDGKQCKLIGTTVRESIKVGKGSTLDANGIEVVKPGTVSIQAYGSTRVEVTGLSKFVEGVPEEQQSEVLGSIQMIAGGTLIIADTNIGGGLQALDNSGAVRVTDSFAEGALGLGKNKGGVSVKASFLGEGVEISETEGGVTFTGNTSDESDLTIAKTKGNVTVENNPSLGENFEVSETTSGLVKVLDNTINDNVDISNSSGGAIVSGNKVGDNLALYKIIGGPVSFVPPCDPLDLECTLGEPALEGTVIVAGNTVGDNVGVLEPGGDVTFTANLVEGSASIDKIKGHVTADGNTTGYVPDEPEPGAVPEVPSVASAGSLLVSEAFGGTSVGDNMVAGDLGVRANLAGTEVSDNHVGVGITVSKNRGGTEVSANQAGGDIECIDNDPAATGGGNVAGTDGSGSLKGQCAGL